MKHFALAAVLLLSCTAFAADTPAKCVIAEKSILSRSDNSIPPVSNLGDIEVTCSTSGRPWPRADKLPVNRSPLTLTTIAYRVSPDGTKTLVPSLAHLSGAGFRNCQCAF